MRLLCVTGVHFIVYPLSTGLAMNRFLIVGVYYFHANGREWCVVTVYKDQELPLQTSKGDAANGKKLRVKAGSVLIFETPANKHFKG